MSCLFAVPDNNNAIEGSFPRCKKAKSRGVAFKLLTELVKEYVTLSFLGPRVNNMTSENFATGRAHSFAPSSLTPFLTTSSAPRNYQLLLGLLTVQTEGIDLGNDYDYQPSRSEKSRFGMFKFNLNLFFLSGYLGVVNQGATCYMNSLLQQLYMTPSFR